MNEEMRGQPFEVIALPVERAGEVVEVLSDAFLAYPVMKYVLGARPDYEADLRALVEFFVMARFLRDDLVLGAMGGGDTLAGVATITLPGELPGRTPCSPRTTCDTSCGYPTIVKVTSAEPVWGPFDPACLYRPRSTETISTLAPNASRR